MVTATVNQDNLCNILFSLLSKEKNSFDKIIFGLKILIKLIPIEKVFCWDNFNLLDILQRIHL